MNFEEFDKEIKDMQPNLRKQLRSVAVKVGHAASKDFEGHFDEQGMNGKKWKEVKRRIPGTPEYKYPKIKDKGRRKRNILIGKNAKLKKAVNKSYKGFTADQESVTVHMRVDSEHGIYLQEGTKHMVARPYVGESDKLDTTITKLVQQNIDLDKK